MKKVLTWSVLIVCACAVSAFAQNKVVFDNQSGEPALVKLIGPTQKEVEVPNGAKAGTDATAGRYVIKVRYGTPGKYRYSKGEEFQVTETATAKSETTITLHKVVAGNYDSAPISEKDFGTTQVVGNTSPTPPSVSASETQTRSKQTFSSPTLEVTLRSFRWFDDSFITDDNRVQAQTLIIEKNTHNASKGFKLIGLLCNFECKGDREFIEQPEQEVQLYHNGEKCKPVGLYMRGENGLVGPMGKMQKGFSMADRLLFLVPESATEQSLSVDAGTGKPRSIRKLPIDTEER